VHESNRERNHGVAGPMRVCVGLSADQPLTDRVPKPQVAGSIPAGPHCRATPAGPHLSPPPKKALVKTTILTGAFVVWGSPRTKEQTTTLLTTWGRSPRPIHRFAASPPGVTVLLEGCQQLGAVNLRGTGAATRDIGEREL
jgi:hypothetical protein